MIRITVTYQKPQGVFWPSLNGHTGGHVTNRIAGLKGCTMKCLFKGGQLMRFLTGLIIVFWSGAAIADIARYPVMIQTPEGRQYLYQLELAANPAARKQGLMERYDLGNRDGMLFVWPDEDYRSFWMKNTPLSLDILFFSSELFLVSRHENTMPFSERLLPSGKPARYVVELKAGQAQLQGMKTGSLLILPEALIRALHGQS